MISNIDKEVEEQRDEDYGSDPEKVHALRRNARIAPAIPKRHIGPKLKNRAVHAFLTANRIHQQAGERRTGCIDVSQRVCDTDRQGKRNCARNRTRCECAPLPRDSKHHAAVSATIIVSMMAAKVLKSSVRPSRQPQKTSSRVVTVTRLREHQEAGQPERVPCRVMRLVPQEAMQAVDREAEVEPTRHGVDVHVLEHRERRCQRLPALPEKPDPLEALEAREHERSTRCNGRSHRAAHPLPDEAVQEEHEGQRQRDRVDEKHLLQRDAALHHPVLGRREQMRKPVVVEGLAAQEGIAWRNRSLADLGDDGHTPDHVRREIRPVCAAPGNRLPNACERPSRRWPAPSPAAAAPRRHPPDGTDAASGQIAARAPVTAATTNAATGATSTSVPRTPAIQRPSSTRLLSP